MIKKTAIATSIFGSAAMFSVMLPAAAFSLLEWGEPSPNNRTYGNVSCAWADAPPEYVNHINRAAEAFKIQPALIGAIYRSEHAGEWYHPERNQERSSSNALGPFQFQPPTWQGYAVDPSDPTNGSKNQVIRNDPERYSFEYEYAAFAAANYLSQMLKNNIHVEDTMTTDENHIRSVALAYASGVGAYQHWRDLPQNQGKPVKEWEITDYTLRTGGTMSGETKKKYQEDAWQYFQELLPSCSTVTTQGTGGTGDRPAPFFIQKIQQNWLTASNESGPRVKGKMLVSGIVLHWTAGQNVEGAVSAMTSAGSYTQLIIDKDGKVYQLLPLDTRVASGSGDGNSFAIGIEIVGGTVNTPPADIERELMDNTTQYQAVLNTVKYLVETYNIPNVIGNKENLDMKRGIFGHLQTQSRNGSWEGLSKGCRGAKNDPGPNYMKRVWADLGSTGDSCI